MIFGIPDWFNILFLCPGDECFGVGFLDYEWFLHIPLTRAFRRRSLMQSKKQRGVPRRSVP